MAFKRDGDDLSQLHLLRKRRVADLLTSYIPEDEAILMKNGRYACAVCYNRPVFDTLEMLTIHRRGKKHVASLQRFYGNQRALQREIQKRRHQEYVREEESGSGEQQTRTEPAPLLSRTRRITHHALLRAAPYNSCCRQNRPVIQNHPGHSNAAAPSQQSPAGGVTETLRVAEDSSRTDSQLTVLLPTSEDSKAAGGIVGTSRKKKAQGCPEERVGRAARKGKRKSRASTPPTPADPDKQKQLEHYLKLKSSGWIQDGHGRWTQDETAEFDSDEEEPPPLLSP
ncbi:sodium channel modifier 1 [Mustelus asterias]